MPKSARNKVVSLTQTDKKGRENKERIADELRKSLDQYNYVWILDVENMRNQFLQQIRQDWDGSRIMFGKTKLLQAVMGRNVEDEYLENLHKFSSLLKGSVGLLFTNEEPTVVKDYFETFEQKDFARSGTEAPLTFEIPAGIVYATGGQMPVEDDVPIAHSLESTLRNLGMPTRLVAGKVELTDPFTVCTEGETLDSKKASLLKQFGVACATFKVHLLGRYSKADASIEVTEN